MASRVAEMTMIQRILASALTLTAVAGCATSRPDPAKIGQPVAEVVRQGSCELISRFIHDGTIYAVGKSYDSTYQSDLYLIFIDDRLVRAGLPALPGYDWKWSSQPDGLAYLAGVLRGSGAWEEVATRELGSATVPIPTGKQPIPEAEKAPEDKSDGASGMAAAAGGIAAYSAVLAVGIVTLPLTVPAAAVIATSIRRTESKRLRIDPGMNTDAVTKMLGRPSVVFTLEGSATQVLAYGMGGWSRNVAGSWYVGVRDQQVIWTHARDEWLDGLAEQAIEIERKRR